MQICLQFENKDVYCVCKVDIVREVLRLGKGVNERAHPSCGAIFSPLQKSLFGCICQICLFCY